MTTDIRRNQRTHKSTILIYTPSNTSSNEIGFLVSLIALLQSLSSSSTFIFSDSSVESINLDMAVDTHCPVSSQYFISF